VRDGRKGLYRPVRHRESSARPLSAFGVSLVIHAAMLAMGLHLVVGSSPNLLHVFVAVESAAIAPDASRSLEAEESSPSKVERRAVTYGAKASSRVAAARTEPSLSRRGEVTARLPRPLPESTHVLPPTLVTPDESTVGAKSLAGAAAPGDEASAPGPAASSHAHFDDGVRSLPLHDAERLTDVPALATDAERRAVITAGPAGLEPSGTDRGHAPSAEVRMTGTAAPSEPLAHAAEPVGTATALPNDQRLSRPAPAVAAVPTPAMPPVPRREALVTASSGAAKLLAEVLREPSGPRSRSAPGVPEPPASPVGIGRLAVRVNGPRLLITQQPVERVSGRVLGGRAHDVVLYLNGTPRAIALDGETFDVPLELQPGLNDVRVVARGSAGGETEDAVAIQFNPAAIRITSPRDGDAAAAGDPPFVVVEGEIQDPAATEVSILVNDLRVRAAVRQGRFRRAVPVLEAVTRVRAQAQHDAAASETVTVHTETVSMIAALIVIDRSNDSAPEADISGTWRSRADRLDVPVYPVSLRRFSTPRQDPGSEIIYLPDMRPGVYRFVVPARGGVGEPTRAMLYLRRPEGVTQRPLRLSSDGNAVLQTRLLLPQGVWWEQDDWFTGRSEGGETITKFRLPEGITWTERRGALR
jgi:hypothetical protein